MSLHKLNIRIKLLTIIVLLFFSFEAISQTDSIWNSYKTQFNENLTELNDLYCWWDANFYPGKFKLNSSVDFQSEFDKLNLTVFPTLSDKAEDFYQFLEDLGVTEKQNFIRYYTFYEGDFEAALKSAQLPLELKQLAPALSAMNPRKVNFEGKVGIWQLTHFQAVLNGLEVNKLVDERFNEHISTVAIARILKQNIEIFKSPELAVLAYLLGNVKVKNAIYFAGENLSINEVLKQLPESASHLIAAFQGTAVFLNTNRFKPTLNSLVKATSPDTVKINRKMHFRQISDVLQIPEKQLEFLNPQFKFDIVPGNEKQKTVIIPNGKWDDFVLWQDSIYNRFDSTLFQFTTQKIEYPPAPNRQYLGEPVKDLVIEGKTKIRYMLKTGDVLGIIAEKYDVRVADLMYWNNISNERRIQAGKKLDIFIDDDKVGDFADANETLEKKKDTSVNMVKQFQQQSTLAVFEELNARPKVEHIVKSGESPFTIAKHFDGVSPEEILQWNGISDARKIQIGQKLIIYLSK